MELHGGQYSLLAVRLQAFLFCLTVDLGRGQDGNIPFSFFKLLFFKIFFLNVFNHDRERGADTGRGRSRLHAGRLTWDSISGPQGHTPG